MQSLSELKFDFDINVLVVDRGDGGGGTPLFEDRTALGVVDVDIPPSENLVTLRDRVVL